MDSNNSQILGPMESNNSQILGPLGSNKSQTLRVPWFVTIEHHNLKANQAGRQVAGTAKHKMHSLAKAVPVADWAFTSWAFNSVNLFCMKLKQLYALCGVGVHTPICFTQEPANIPLFIIIITVFVWR